MTFSAIFMQEFCALEEWSQTGALMAGCKFWEQIQCYDETMKTWSLQRWSRSKCLKSQRNDGDWKNCRSSDKEKMMCWQKHCPRRLCGNRDQKDSLEASVELTHVLPLIFLVQEPWKILSHLPICVTCCFLPTLGYVKLWRKWKEIEPVEGEEKGFGIKKYLYIL